MHRDRLSAKYDADAQVKQLVWSMGKTFQKLSANKKFFQVKNTILGVEGIVARLGCAHQLPWHLIPKWRRQRWHVPSRLLPMLLPWTT